MKHINLPLLEEKISREVNHIDKSLLDSIKNYVQTSEKAKISAKTGIHLHFLIMVFGRSERYM
jgi:hypothetical protein